jgi:hypothetical protein
MTAMPAGNHAVDRAVLAHRRHADAVAESDILEFEGLKECGHDECVMRK